MKTAIIIAILAIALPVSGLSITANSERENDNDRTVFFTVTDGEATYQWHGDIPIGAHRDNYLNAKAEEILLLILKKQYPGANPVAEEGQTELEAMRAWIRAGAVNVSVSEVDGEEVVTRERIARVEWKSTHPKESEINQLKARIAALEAR